MILTPNTEGMVIFSWDKDKLGSITKSDSIVCELSTGSIETMEYYKENVTFNFVR